MIWDQDSLRALLERSGFGPHIDKMMAYARPSVRIHVTRIPEGQPIPIGTSRLGGQPDLPIGTPWPRIDGFLCEFIAQFDMAEVSRYDLTGLLPKTGMMWFFYEGSFQRPYTGKMQRGRDTIIYRETVPELERLPFPDPIIGRKLWPHPACAVEFFTSWMLPHYFDVIDGMDIFGKPFLYHERSELWHQFQNLHYDVEPNGFERPDEQSHQMLGYPNPMHQDDPIRYVLGELGVHEDGLRIAPYREEWLYLLSINTNDAADMLWGDTGALYYMIRKDDLLARHFDDAMVDSQSA